MSRRYRQASGPSFRECAALGYLSADRSAVVLVRPTPVGPTPLAFGVRCVVDTLMTGLWRAPDGTVFTVDRDGVVRWAADPWNVDGWLQQQLDLCFLGVTGAASGQEVWAWGVRGHDGASLLRRWDGREWRPIGAPGFGIAAACVGNAPWVAGEEGWVARFDGGGWTAVRVGEIDIVAVHAVGDVLYAADADGQLWMGDETGFGGCGRVPARPLALAAWRGSLWVGAGGQGLFRVTEGDATCVRSDRHCRSLEARDELVIGCDAVISGSPDGERFPATGRGLLDGA